MFRFYTVKDWLKDNRRNIRCRVMNGKAWYVASDVTKALGCQDHENKAMRIMLKDVVWYVQNTKRIKTKKHGITSEDLAIDLEGVDRFIYRAGTSQAKKVVNRFWGIEEEEESTTQPNMLF